MDDERPVIDLPAELTGRGLRGRRVARLMIVIAIVPAVLLGALTLSLPATIGPLQSEDPSPLPTIVLGGAISAYVFGLAVMIRIYRAMAEPGPTHWRFRRF